jgi:hypothetical protein
MAVMRTWLIYLTAVSLTAASARAEVCAVPAARVQRVRTYASAGHQRQQLQAYAAPAKTIVREKVREYVAADHVQQYTHSGLNYDYGQHQYFRVGLDVREDAVTEKLYGRLLRDGTVATLVSRAVAESLKAVRPQPVPAGEPAEPLGGGVEGAAVGRLRRGVHGSHAPGRQAGGGWGH